MVRTPYRFSNADCDVRGAAPAPGRDNTAVLYDWLGLAADEIDTLSRSGAFG